MAVGDTLIYRNPDVGGNAQCYYCRETGDGLSQNQKNVERTASDPWGTPYFTHSNVPHGFAVGNWMTVTEYQTHNWGGGGSPHLL